MKFQDVHSFSALCLKWGSLILCMVQGYGVGVSYLIFGELTTQGTYFPQPSVAGRKMPP